MSYEKTQKGNPRKLTTNQHIIPNMLISNFCNKSNFVEVKRIKDNKIFHVKPCNQIFCAKRVWDQRAEQGWMKDIEDCFHKYISKFIRNKYVLNHQLITEYL